MSLLVRTSTDAGALLVRDTDDPLALAVTESTSALALRVRESTSPLAMRVRGLFSPASLPGLAAWYDASDSSTVLTTVSPDVPATDGQTVRRWVSRHNPAVFWDQGTLLNQPTFTNATTGLTFNGTSSFMDGTGTMAGVFRNRGYGYIFAVAQDTNPTGGSTRHAIIAEPILQLFTRRINDKFVSVNRRLVAESAIITESTSANNSNLNILEGRSLWSEGSFAMAVNGVSELTGSFATSGNSESGAATEITLGATASFFFPGNIRELVIVNEQLTAAQILSTRRYLQRKWNTPALP
jgi:hypothetical protein